MEAKLVKVENSYELILDKDRSAKYACTPYDVIRNQKVYLSIEMCLIVEESIEFSSERVLTEKLA